MAGLCRKLSVNALWTWPTRV
ncbi:hypothetical protein LEMLEM_LOCUS9436 [Lemmus lemmus]